MSKRITISLKESEHLEIEKLAKSQSCSVRDVINRRIRESKKIEEIEMEMRKSNKKIRSLKNSMEELKESNLRVQNLLEKLTNATAFSLKSIANQTSFAKDYSNLSLNSLALPQGNTHDTYRSTLEKRAQDISTEIFNEFYKK